jgi:hypothetical protein
MGTDELRRNEDVLQAGRNRGVMAEFWLFLMTSKKWWMLPILIVLLVFGLIVVLGNTAAAPFIYTLF